MRLVNNLRYAFVSAALTVPAFKQLKETAVKLLLGHNKIIGWENFLPVRSLIVPAEYSRPFITSAARLYNSGRYDLHYPGLATLSLTSRCDCDCLHCTAYGQGGNELSTGQWVDIIRKSADLGVFSFGFTGGEPLLREDLAEIIRAVDKKRSICLIYTNGSKLKQRAKELYKAGLRRVLVSIDFPDEQSHDRHRKHGGLMNKALAGLEEARRLGMLVGFSTFVSPERFYSGTVEKIFQLGVEKKVNEIAVFDALPSGRLENQTELKHAAPQYTAELRTFIESWWMKRNAPGVWWYGHFRSFQACGCPGGTSMFNISASGEFRPCDFCKVSVGSVTKDSLEALWIRLNNLAKEQRSRGNECWLLR
ncbi:MAG: radical SAM protein [Candidatus Omnitrophota bacterium]|jgi:MoaA/NifB/PqqE/SkfB family radical SAM enzyme